MHFGADTLRWLKKTATVNGEARGDGATQSFKQSFKLRYLAGKKQLQLQAV